MNEWIGLCDMNLFLNESVTHSDTLASGIMSHVSSSTKLSHPCFNKQNPTGTHL